MTSQIRDPNSIRPFPTMYLWVLAGSSFLNGARGFELGTSTDREREKLRRKLLEFEVFRETTKHK